MDMALHVFLVFHSTPDKAGRGTECVADRGIWKGFVLAWIVNWGMEMVWVVWVDGLLGRSYMYTCTLP